jgi:hypothetical protein
VWLDFLPPVIGFLGETGGACRCFCCCCCLRLAYQLTTPWQLLLNIPLPFDRDVAVANGDLFRRS